MFLALRLLYASALALVCVFAFRSGGRAERWGAGILLVGSLLTLVVEETPYFDWATAREGLLLVDMATLAALFALSARTDRFWPLWATALHLIAVATHFVMLFSPGRVVRAYALAQGFWAYPMFVCIVIGCIRYQRNLRAGLATPGV